jgi:hypothetical protein
LHFDGIHLLELVVEHPWGIDHLKPGCLVFGVTDIQGLGGEREGLHLYIGFADAVDKTGFSHIGKPSEHQSAFIRVDTG